MIVIYLLNLCQMGNMVDALKQSVLLAIYNVWNHVTKNCLHG